ncbi:MAG TPA: hypothetical protein VK524_01505 [Polyangiaceae bacterium]|nr:hypothetical protein [Polyangiaceae bacterium]
MRRTYDFVLLQLVATILTIGGCAIEPASSESVQLTDDSVATHRGAIAPLSPNSAGTAGSGADDEARFAEKATTNWRGTLCPLHEVCRAVQGPDIVGQDIGNNGSDRVYTWTTSGRVLVGTSTNLSSISESSFSSAGTGIFGLRGVAIAKNTQRCYYYYDNGTFTVGTSTDWDAHSGPTSFTSPAGLSPLNLVDVAIATNGRVYYYWLDSSGLLWRTIGDSINSTRYSQRTSISKFDNSILGIAFNASDTSYTWYGTDKIVRTGTSTAL